MSFDRAAHPVRVETLESRPRLRRRRARDRADAHGAQTAPRAPLPGPQVTAAGRAWGPLSEGGDGGRGGPQLDRGRDRHGLQEAHRHRRLWPHRTRDPQAIGRLSGNRALPPLRALFAPCGRADRRQLSLRRGDASRVRRGLRAAPPHGGDDRSGRPPRPRGVQAGAHARQLRPRGDDRRGGALRGAAREAGRLLRRRRLLERAAASLRPLPPLPQLLRHASHGGEHVCHRRLHDHDGGGHGPTHRTGDRQ